MVHNACEIVIEESSYEKARNTAIEKIGEINPANREPYIGKMGVGKDKVVGFDTRVEGEYKRYRLDYDPKKGPHINVDMGGKKGEKFAIKFPGSESDVSTILKKLQK